MNILFVCSSNKWRSTTAETIFKNHPEHQVRSAGTEPSATIKINAKQIAWADLLFVMEKKHKQRILANFSAEASENQIIILDIPDEYQYMDEVLVEELNSKVANYI